MVDTTQVAGQKILLPERDVPQAVALYRDLERPNGIFALAQNTVEK